MTKEASGNRFEQVDEPADDAMTLSLKREGEKMSGVVTCPAAITGGRLPKDFASDEMPLKDAFRSAIRLANDTRYGLNASVWGKDLRRAARIGAQLEAGNVNVNDGFAASFASKGTPSGGWKASGVGVRHGDAGLLKYTDTTNLATLKQQVYNPRPGQSYEQYAQQTKQVLRWMRKLRIR